MLKRYINEDVSPAQIRIAGQDFGTVETGDAIVVPNDLANSVAWPEGNWEDVTEDKTDNNNKDNGSDGGE